ncbi:MAG TPA: radical SAM protein [Kiritimatiellia bacterium]|nr:radical SAM protein [Kiritimatiellia bacterium]HRZ11683.1 radical SAM protein [Kiritimatiellia bacterium]HSA16766.1 radical SAM protein [Kiritimatiellia bacterium]
MNISLVYPQWTEEYGQIAHFAKKAGKWPPLNLAYLAAIAEAAGHRVRITDAEAEALPMETTVDRVLAEKPDLVGVTATTPFYHIACDLAAQIRKRSAAPIAIGGPHVTVLREAAFPREMDFAFIGEADRTWPAFLERFADGRDPGDVPGLLYRQDGKVRYTGPALPVEDLNALPVPARHLLKADRYFLGTLEGAKRFTSIMTVRGCPYRCIFCSTKVFGRDTRRRDPPLVLDEIRDCVERFGIEHFMFMDDTLTLHREHIRAICRLLIEARLNITFEGSTRANLVDEETVRLMRKAGLIRLSFGLESVDPGIRKTMRKQVPLESYIQANRLTRKHGIETLNSCMIGLPGETRETIRATLRFLRESREIEQANISIAVPYPGTELYEMARRGEMGLRLETEDFSQYRRYNAAVMTVGDLSPADLVEIQNEAFASIYLAPWRWRPMIAKSGAMGAVLTARRLARALKEGRSDFLTDRQLGISAAAPSLPPSAPDAEPGDPDSSELVH